MARPCLPTAGSTGPPPRLQTKLRTAITFGSVWAKARSKYQIEDNFKWYKFGSGWITRKPGLMGEKPGLPDACKSWFSWAAWRRYKRVKILILCHILGLGLRPSPWGRVLPLGGNPRVSFTSIPWRSIHLRSKDASPRHRNHQQASFLPLLLKSRVVSMLYFMFWVCFSFAME